MASALGEFSGNTNIALKPNQPLVLQVAPQPPSARNILLQIVEIAGRPVAQPAQGLQGDTIFRSPTGTAPAQSTAQPAAPATVSLTAGQVVTGVVVQTAALNPAPAASPGTPTGASPAAATLPAGQAGNPPPTAAPGPKPVAPTTSASPPPTARPPAGAGTTPAQPPQAGVRVTLGIVSVTPAPSAPGNPPGAAAAPSVGQTFTATVSGTTQSGQPIVSTPLGNIAIDRAPPLPKGAEIVFRLEAPPSAPVEGSRLGGSDGQIGLRLGYAWQTLDELTAALASRSAAATTAGTDRIVSLLTPQTDAKLGTTLLFLLAAFKGGDLKSWLGETAMREIERLRPDMLRRLGDDVRLLAGDGDEADGRIARTADWRSLPLPLFGAGIEQSRLLVRRDGGGNPDEDGKPGNESRFVVDLRLTSIGRLQLDGLIDTDARRFDMLVRTTSALPARFRSDILQIFSAANETIGMTGGLSFRATPDALIETADAAPDRGATDGLMV